MYLMENIFVILRTTRSEDDLSPLSSQIVLHNSGQVPPLTGAHWGLSGAHTLSPCHWPGLLAVSQSWPLIGHNSAQIGRERSGKKPFKPL